MASNYYGDPNNMLGTPAGYATPSQIRDMYDYSRYLSQGDAQQTPITKWTQGVSNMVNALMGGWLSNRANSLQRGTTQYDVSNLPSAPQWPTSIPSSSYVPSASPPGSNSVFPYSPSFK